ncbi:MAG: response regulator transcription factor [Desulfobacterales bacterium]|nr:response regulator transcription factor [Desulfobacterales bacterium]
MKILVVEDDIKLADFVCTGLQQSGYVVDACDNGIDGLHLFLTETYEAAVLDIMLPGLSGLDIVEKGRQSKILTPVIFLSARASVDDRVSGLKAGADDYLVKPFSMSELLARIQAIIRRTHTTVESSELEYHGVKMDQVRREVSRDGRLIELQPKEFALLQLMLKNPERVLSKTLILESLWDYNFDPQTNVVDVLVYRLRNKIDREYRTKYVHTLRGVGYVFKKVE